MTPPVIAVKWVHQMNAAEVGGVMQSGQKVSLCVRVKERVVCVAAGRPVRVVLRSVEEFNIARDVTHPGTSGPYPIPEAVSRLESIAKTFGITPSAVAVLSIAKEWTKNPTSLSRVELQHFINEEELNEMSAETNSAGLSPVSVPEASKAVPKTPKEPPVKASKPVSKAPKVKAKGSPVKASKPVVKAPKVKAKGSSPVKAKAPKTSPYRVGGPREKAYQAFLSETKAVLAMEPAKRREWAGKLGRKLGLASITAETYVQRFIRAHKA